MEVEANTSLQNQIIELKAELEKITRPSNQYIKGRQWCKTCDPERLVESWNIENNRISECILNNVKKANHYDDPFLEYIPYENFEIIKRIGEGSYGVVYHAKWHNGLRYCEGGARCKKKVADVAIKEIKSGYDVTLDFISMVMNNNIYAIINYCF
ncbi:20647_t:CDS:2 [Entrophospora sp. SA101]|nr:20647_t:CDS:2 [Entrophospora sp. SA101]